MNLAGMINKVFDKIALIDKVAVFIDEFPIVGNTLFQAFFIIQVILAW